MKETDVDELSANREAAGLVTRLGAEVRVREPVWLLEGESDCHMGDTAEPEENTRKVVEKASNLTEETLVEPLPVGIW